MNPMLLTKSTTFFIGQIAALLGLLMNGIFWVLDKIGIPNIGLSIILFTIVIYMALMPLTIKQQRFSKLSQKMQPELKKIQDKYKGKKDQDSMMKQNEEIQQVYRKYGVSASGSCVQLLIQMPILFALYQVIYRIPAYVTQVKAAFFPLVDNLIATKGSAEFLQKFSVASQFAGNFKNEKFTSGVTSYVQNTYIDVLNRISTSDWQTLAAKYPSLKADISSTTSLLNKYNNFLGLNMGDTPWYTIKAAYASGKYLLIVGAILVPVLAALTQWIGVKLTPVSNTSTGDPQQDSMARQMQTMNVIMPLMSAWFCFTLPAGMGLYWIAGAVIRAIQQVVINKKIDKEDIDALIERNIKKNEEKLAKNSGRQTVSQRVMAQYATMNTRNIEAPEKKLESSLTEEEKAAALKKAQEKTAGKKYRAGSLAEKANMVSDYNNHHQSR